MNDRTKIQIFKVFNLLLLAISLTITITMWRDPNNHIGKHDPDRKALASHAHGEYNPHLMEAPRSGSWPTVRRHYLEQPGNDRCAVCGTTEQIEVHHVKPFHEHPELELNPTNFITLCRDHHFRVGHNTNWKNSNPNVREDAKKLHDKLNPNRKGN